MGLISFSKNRRFDDLSYANPNEPKWKQVFVRVVEAISGRGYFVSVYDQWRKTSLGKSDRVMGDLLVLSNIEVQIKAGTWSPKQIPETPLVLMANHPFGISDGIALCAMAEKWGRPFKVLLNNELLKIFVADQF